MFQPCQQHARALLLGGHEVDDVHDAGYRVSGIAKKLEADRAYIGRHAVYHPARAGYKAVAAFFLYTGQATQEFVSDILAKTFLAKARTRYVHPLRAFQRLAICLVVIQLKAGYSRVMDFAHVVVEANDFQPGCLWRHHPPRRQVVQRSAPQHGLFATSVHRNVAANAGGFCRCRVHRENKTATFGRVRHALRHHAGLRPNRGHRLLHARQDSHLHLGHRFQLLGVNDRAFPCEWAGAACVTRSTATRDDGQAEVDATLDQACHFNFRIGGEHHERVFNSPVSGVGHVRYPTQAIKLNVVPGCQLA